MNIIYFTHIHYLQSLIFAVFEFLFHRNWAGGRWWKQPSRHSRDHSTV